MAALLLTFDRVEVRRLTDSRAVALDTFRALSAVLMSEKVRRAKKLFFACGFVLLRVKNRFYLFVDLFCYAHGRVKEESEKPEEKM